MHPLLERDNLRHDPSRFQRGIQRRLHTVGIVMTGRPVAARALPHCLLLLQEGRADMVLPGQGQECAIAVKNLADQVQRFAQPVGFPRGDGHAPRHPGKTEFHVIAAGEAGLGQVIGEKAVVLRRQRAGTVLQARR